MQPELAHIPCPIAETIRKQHVRKFKIILCKLRLHLHDEPVTWVMTKYPVSKVKNEFVQGELAQLHLHSDVAELSRREQAQYIRHIHKIKLILYKNIFSLAVSYLRKKFYINYLKKIILSYMKKNHLEKTMQKHWGFGKKDLINPGMIFQKLVLMMNLKTYGIII